MSSKSLLSWLFLNKWVSERIINQSADGSTNWVEKEVHIMSRHYLENCFWRDWQVSHQSQSKKQLQEPKNAPPKRHEPDILVTSLKILEMQDICLAFESPVLTFSDFRTEVNKEERVQAYPPVSVDSTKKSDRSPDQLEYRPPVKVLEVSCHC